MNKGLDFQEKVFDLVAAKLKDKWPGATFTISDLKRGPIDIVAVVRRAESGLALANEAAYEIEEQIFLECKDYADKLGLDTTGKAYCVALAEQPSYLIIVSRKGLSPQALRFAGRLFRCHGLTNFVLDSNKYSIQSPLSAIDFLHYTLDELENGIIPATPTKNDSNLKCDITPAFSLNAWSLIDSDGAHSLIANNATPLDSIVPLKRNRDLRFEVVLESCTGKFSFNEKQITLSIGKAPLFLSPSNAQSDFETFLSIEFILNKEQVKLLSSHSSSSLHISGNNGPSVVQISLPKIQCIDDTDIFSNFRLDLEDSVFNELVHNRQACLIVEGAAGVGKSYLCSNLSKRLSTAHGFKEKTIHLSRREPSTFLIQLVLDLLDFSGSPSPSEKDSYSFSILSAYMQQFIHDGEMPPNLKEGDTRKGNISELPLDFLVSLCVKSISEVHEPCIVWFQNCQAALPETLYALDRVCSELTNQNWNNLHFIFEYRTNSHPTTAWSEFKTSRTIDPKAGCHLIALDELASSHVKQAISPLFPPTMVHEVAQSLYKKTGGNPLYMDHVIRHFLSRGYIQIIPQAKNAIFFRVLDFGGIQAELSVIAESTTQFLQRRIACLIEAVDCTKGDINKTVVKHLLWLQALTPQPPVFIQLTQVLDVNPDDIHKAMRYLVSERILSDHSFHGSISFFHELIGLAAHKIQLQPHEQSSLAENLASCSSQEELRDCLNVGVAMAEARRLLDAELWLQAGVESSIIRSDYYYQRLIFRKLDEVLENSDQRTMLDKAKWLDVKMGLGWAELQAGSLIEAKLAYQSIEELCKWPFDRSDPNSCRLEKGYKLKALHRLATVDIELLEITQSLKSMHDVIGVVNDKNLLFHISNRLLLALMLTNQSSIGLAVAPFCLSLGECCTDSDSLSVIMSDLGSLFFAENPKLTSDLWEIGLTAAVDKRQKTHSLINRLVINTVLTRKLSDESYQVVKAEIISQKLNGQLTRMELLRGAGAILAEDYYLAEQCFSSALKKAISQNQTLFRWLATYNLSVCRIALGIFDGVCLDLAALEQELADININNPHIHANCIVAKDLLEHACERLSISPKHQYKHIHLPNTLSSTGPLFALSGMTKELSEKMKNNENKVGQMNDHERENSHIISLNNYSYIVV